MTEDASDTANCRAEAAKITPRSVYWPLQHISYPAYPDLERDQILAARVPAGPRLMQYNTEYKNGAPWKFHPVSPLNKGMPKNDLHCDWPAPLSERVI